MRVTNVLVILAAFTGLSLCAAARHQPEQTPPPPRYTVTDLGPGRALDINSQGQVAGLREREGAAKGTGLRKVAVLWDERQVSRELNNLPGDVAWGIVGKAGRDIALNDQGEIAGTVMIGDPRSFVYHAVLWRDGRVQRFGKHTATIALNNKGSVLLDVAGVGKDPYDERFGDAGVFTNGRVVLLGAVSRERLRGASDINDSGQVVANLVDKPASSEAELIAQKILWENGVSRKLQRVPVAAPGGEKAARSPDMAAFSILNNHGQIVGLGRTPEPNAPSGALRWRWHMMRWENGVMRDLGTLRQNV